MLYSTVLISGNLSPVTVYLNSIICIHILLLYVHVQVHEYKPLTLQPTKC